MLHPVVYEDNHLIVVDKPAVLATMGSGQDERSLARDVKEYLRRKYQKPGNAYLGIVSRLDSVTTGLIVFAKTSKAAARLTSQFQKREVRKYYLAVVPSVHSVVETASAAITRKTAPDLPWHQWLPVQWEDQLFRDQQSHRMRKCPESRRATVETIQARLAWRLVGEQADRSLVMVQLETGRKHQIRVQFAERDLPVWGDRKYGSSHAFPSGIALHSWHLSLAHPVTKQTLQFTQPPPATWNSLGAFHLASNLPPLAPTGKPLKPTPLADLLGAAIT